MGGDRSIAAKSDLASLLGRGFILRDRHHNLGVDHGPPLGLFRHRLAVGAGYAAAGVVLSWLCWYLAGPHLEIVLNGACQVRRCCRVPACQARHTRVSQPARRARDTSPSVTRSTPEGLREISIEYCGCTATPLRTRPVGRRAGVEALETSRSGLLAFHHRAQRPQRSDGKGSTGLDPTLFLSGPTLCSLSLCGES